MVDPPSPASAAMRPTFTGPTCRAPGASAGRRANKGQYSDVPDGGDIRFETADRHLLTAIHRWFGAQVSDRADAKDEAHQRYHSIWNVVARPRPKPHVKTSALPSASPGIVVVDGSGVQIEVPRAEMPQVVAPTDQEHVIDEIEARLLGIMLANVAWRVEPLSFTL